MARRFTRPVDKVRRSKRAEQFKPFAKLEGIGYQPLMRQVLTRYARENEHRLKPKPGKS